MRNARWLALVGVFALVTQACSGSTASTAPSTAAESAAATEAPTEAPAEATTLTVLEHQDLRVKTLNELKPAFEAAMKAQGKNITLNIVDAAVANDDEFKQKVVAEYSGEPTFDVTSYPSSWMPDFATAGYVSDLTDRLAAWSDWNDHFYPVLRERAQQADGKYYSVPRHGSILEFFVRKDILDKYGVSTAQPNSWDELVARLKEVKKASGGLPAVTLPAGKSWGGGSFDEGFRLMFLGTGSELFDTTQNKWIVKSEGLTDVFTLYATLQKEGLLPTKALLEPNPWEPTKYDGFTGTDKDGNAIPVAPPISTQGSWGWIYDWGPTGARPIPDIQKNVITWAFPSKTPNQNYVYATEDWMWTISAKSQNQDAAWEFVKWMNTGEALAKDLAAIGNVAPRDDVQGIAPYSDMPYLIEMEKLLPSGKSLRDRPGVDKIQQAIASATELILLNKADGAKAAEEFAKEAADLLGPDNVIQ